MHTNARTKGRWETFTLNVNVVSNATMLQTLNGNDVTAVNGGGIGTIYSVPVNTSRRQPGTWEVFTLAG